MEAARSVVWMGDSVERVRGFPKPARREVGFQLDRVQRGLDPRDWRPMPLVGQGVIEIRVHGGNEYRVFYVAKWRRAVYVLHAFIKKSRKTRRAEIAVARARYAELMAED